MVAPLEQSLSRFIGCSIGLFLVSIPVILQAPLVRFWPWLSLGSVSCWVLGGLYLLRQGGRQAIWGDLLLGFTWSWLAGSLYWGWLREEPLLHLPVEAIGIPAVMLALCRQQLLVGHCFYLGSFLGTAVTDLYFYALDLIPYWRRVMQVDFQDSLPILSEAIFRVQSVAGAAWAVLLVSFLIFVGSLGLKSKEFHWWVFSGAVLGTLLVDALFALSALL